MLSDEERKNAERNVEFSSNPALVEMSAAVLRPAAELAAMKQQNAALTKELEACKRIERERWEKAAKIFGIRPATKEVRQ